MANLVYKGSRANLPAVRNADSFYMCEDTREIYFGNNLYTEAVRFYEGTTKPTNPAQGVLYISLASGDGDAYDGKTWHSVFAGSAGVDKKISDAIEALEVEDTAVDHQFVTAVAQEDGKVKVSRKPLAADDIPAIPQSKVTGLEEALEDKADIGESGDEASDDTIHGAKAYADEAVEAAKTALIGTDSDAASAATIKGAKKYADEQIAAKVSSVYKPSGSKQFSELAGLLADEAVGTVYNITDADGFTTDSTFVEGAGKHYPVGTNVVCVNDGGKKWDVLAGVVDLTDYAKTEQVTQNIAAAKTELIGTGDGVTATTIKGAVTEAKGYVDGEIEELGIDGLKSRVSTIEETLTVGTFAAD